jgi:hypothetical protein
MIKKKIKFNTNYLSDSFDNDVKFALDIIEMYLKIVPDKLVELNYFYQNKNSKQINIIIRQNLIVFNLLGFPDLAKRFGSLLINSDDENVFCDFKANQLELLIQDIELSFFIVKEEQAKLSCFNVNSFSLTN